MTFATRRRARVDLCECVRCGVLVEAFGSSHRLRSTGNFVAIVDAGYRRFAGPDVHWLRLGSCFAASFSTNRLRDGVAQDGA